MKRIILLCWTILLISSASKAQDTTFCNNQIGQTAIIDLMNNYETRSCLWQEEYSETNKFLGWRKVIEVTPRDTEIVTSIYFYSNIVKDKKNKKNKLEVMYARINQESVVFVMEVENNRSVLSTTKSPFPKLEAEMTKWLEQVPIGIKKAKIPKKAKDL